MASHSSLHVTDPPRPERATNLSVGAAIVAFANAVQTVIVSFGLHLSAQQEASVTGVVNATVLLVIAVSHVYGQITAERERWTHLNGPDG